MTASFPANAGFKIELDFTDVGELFNFYQTLKEPLFTLKDAGLISKLFQDWQKAGLWFHAFAPAEKRQWTRLNLEEYIWLKFIKQLRQLGASTEIILKVKAHLLAPFDLAKHLSEPKYLAKAIADFEEYNLPKEQKEEILLMVKSGEFIRQIEAAGLMPSQLLVMLFTTMIKHYHVGVFVFPEGEVIIWSEEILSMDAGAMELYQWSHIYLSINQHLVDFLLEPEKDKFISPLQLLSSEERLVLNSMRDKTLKKLEIKLKTKKKTGQASTTLITTREGKMAKADYDRVAGKLISKNYDSIRAVNFNGTEVYFERQKRRKL
jgi:hypothetical protein